MLWPFLFTKAQEFTRFWLAQAYRIPPVYQLAEITVDLIRRLGALEGVTEHNSWEAWFRHKYQKEPNYSDSLDAIAPTPTERRAILHGYIEPKEGDESRRPTKAHHAIAKLVVDGAFRVIVTTNFDRLIENALREAGVEPIVIASEDALTGALPLVHARCTVIKLHGDYLDTRIKNAEAELGSYTPRINALLDEIFDCFGLLVVGWSGEWDTALRSALLRAPNRRYALYWAARGRIAPLAQDIITHRSGRSFEIADADSFFSRLSEMVDALRQAQRPHPQSVAMSAALAKKYCRDDRYAVEWAEFLAAEAGKIRSFVTGKEYPTVPPTTDPFNALISTFISRSEILRRACLISGYWGTSEANRTLVRTIRSLGFGTQPVAGYQYWLDLRNFCASLCFYWALLGAVARDDFVTARTVMYARLKINIREEQAFVYALPILHLGSIEWKMLKGLERRKTPASDFLFELVEQEITEIAVDPSEADDLFDRVELLISLEFAYLRLQSDMWLWVPVGRYIWKRDGVMARLAAYGNLSDDDPIVRAGLLGGTRESAKKIVDALQKFFNDNPSFLF